MSEVAVPLDLDVEATMPPCPVCDEPLVLRDGWLVCEGDDRRWPVTAFRAELGDDELPQAEDDDRAAMLDAEFQRFHDAHPEIYADLVRMARTAKNAGHVRYSIAALFEVLRWERTVLNDGSNETGPPDAFKLNNNLRSRYARLIMREVSDLDDFFEVRALRS